MTGADLKTTRLNAGLSQYQLAGKAGVSRDTVQYWEGKQLVDVKGWGPKRIIEALGLRVYSHQYAPARGWGLSGLSSMQEWLDRRIEAELARLQARAGKAKVQRRVICGAKTRKGAPCRMKSEPGKQRCKYHGGKSTGPRTQEGKERIAAAQRRRWALWHKKRPPAHEA